jgi:uncharacterized membrane protein YccC
MTQRTGPAPAASVPGSPAPAVTRGRAWIAYLRPTWSRAAALRAVRAGIVVPGLFAVTFKVIGNPQMAIFAVFGSFSALVFVSFGGDRANKVIAHLGLAVAGSLALIIGTLVSGHIWVAALITIPVTFAIYFAGIAGPNAASASSAVLLAYVLPVATAGGAGTVPARLAGWWLAAAVSTAAVVLLSPRSAGDQLRECAAAASAALSHLLRAAVGGMATEADREAVIAAKHDLMSMFAATPYRPIGLAAADQALARVINLLEWCAGLGSDATDGHLDLTDAAEQDRLLLAQSAAGLTEIAALLRGQASQADPEPLLRASAASASNLLQMGSDQATVLRRTEHAFYAQAIGSTVAAALGHAVTAARRPGSIAARWRGWLAGRTRRQADRDPAAPGRLARTARVVATDASIRSTWFRNSARGAVALAAAVTVAKLTDVQHGFWVVLGTLSVLRTSAAATGSTAARALAGTVAGFVLGAGVLLALGTDPVALWAVLPVAVLIAAYAPGTAPFLVGQAAFTVTIVVLFNLLVPAGWRVGLLRVEDVAIGCAVSVVVGFLFWPRGAASLVGDNLADALRRGASYLDGAVGWALGDREQRPERAIAAITASTRLDDALRGYLTEQGSKRVSKMDLWVLVMAAMRLRLTAHSLASLPLAFGPAGDGSARSDGSAVSDGSAGGVAHGVAGHDVAGSDHAVLDHQTRQLADFYEQIAVLVGKPGRPLRSPPAVGPPARLAAPVDPCRNGQRHYHPEALWVRHHLESLGAHARDLPEPATRLALVRRRPWWR